MNQQEWDYYTKLLGLGVHPYPGEGLEYKEYIDALAKLQRIVIDNKKASRDEYAAEIEDRKEILKSSSLLDYGTDTPIDDPWRPAPEPGDLGFVPKPAPLAAQGPDFRPPPIGATPGRIETGAIAGPPGSRPVPSDPRFERWPSGQIPRMVDPNQLPAGAMGRNRPPEYFAYLEKLKQDERMREQMAEGQLPPPRWHYPPYGGPTSIMTTGEPAAAALDLPPVQDITPPSRLAPPIDELSFTRTAPTAARQLDPVQDITPWSVMPSTVRDITPRPRERPAWTAGESISPVDATAPTAARDLPTGIDVPPREFPREEEAAETEGYLTGITGGERTLLPTVGDKTIYPEIPLPVEATDEDDEVEGGDFHSRLAGIGDLSDQFRYPSGFMDPRIMAGRQRLQKRRNFLRTLYKMPQKDIVWPEGSSTTDLLKRWEAEKKRLAMMAFTATMPQHEGDVLDLINALGADTDTAKAILQIYKDSRPDLAYEKQNIEMLQAKDARDAKLLAQLAVKNSIVNGVFDENKFKQNVADIGELGALEDEFFKVAEGAKKLLSTDPPNEQEYTIPWAWEDTPRNRKLLAQMGVHFTEKAKGGPARFGDKPWLLVRPDRANVVRTFNINDPDDRNLVNTLSGMNLQGFGKYSPSTPAQYLSLVDPSGQVFGQPFDANNMSLQDYASHLAAQGVQTMKADDASAQKQQAGEAKKGNIYEKAVRDKRQAEIVIAMAQSLLDANSRIKAKARELGVPPEPLVGGIAGLKFTFDNFMELGGDLFKAFGWSGTPDAPVDYSLNIAVNGLNILRDQINEIAPTASTSAPEELKALQQDFAIWNRDIKDIASEISVRRQAGTYDDMVWQGRIAAKLLSAAMATLVARLYSSTDRLLKLQYMVFRDQLDLHKPWMSERLGIGRLAYLITLGNGSLRAAERVINSVQPSGWTRTSEGLYIGPEAATEGITVEEAPITGLSTEALDAARKEALEILGR
jgi:hypothetical protein